MANKQLEVVSEDHPSPQKWCVPLKEDVFTAFMAKEGPILHKVFGDGSLFSPLLFRKFFDPSDAFPLWEFEAAALLTDLHEPRVDWFQTDTCYVLKADLPRSENISFQVSVENGKVLEISGQWKQQGEGRITDWRLGQWWEQGFVRRLELPVNTAWKKSEAYLHNDILLDIRIPKTHLERETPRGNELVTKESASA